MATWHRHKSYCAITEIITVMRMFANVCESLEIGMNHWSDGRNHTEREACIPKSTLNPKCTCDPSLHNNKCNHVSPTSHPNLPWAPTAQTPQPVARMPYAHFGLLENKESQNRGVQPALEIPHTILPWVCQHLQRVKQQTALMTYQMQ